MRGTRSLWRDRRFLTYWSSQVVWGVGTPVSALAIPLTAVLLLGAGPAEMGLLRAFGNAPFLIAGLAAGVLVDRMRRLPILVVANLGHTFVLALVPLAAILGLLRIEILYVVTLLTGMLALTWVVADQSFIPTLVGRSRLVEANSRLVATRSALEIVGPGIGGLLVQTLTAPIAILVDAVSYAVSALLLASIPIDEPAPRPREEGSRVWMEVREGLHIVLGDTHLRSIMACGATHNIFSNGMLVALFVLFATRELGLSPAELGLVFAAGGPGSLLGSIVSARMSRSFGLGPVLGAMQLLTGVARLAMPLAIVAGPPILVLAAGEFLLGIARAIFNVNQVSLRQSITPDHQQGRMNASIRFLMWAAVPFGALLGGWSGEAIGLVPTLWIGVTGTFLASLWIFLSPVRSLVRAPEPLAT